MATARFYTYVVSQGAEGEGVLLCVGRQPGERPGQGGALGLGEGRAVAVVDVQDGHVTTGHLLNLGAVPLVVDVFGRTKVACKTAMVRVKVKVGDEFHVSQNV
jgi:hypothetical protein